MSTAPNTKRLSTVEYATTDWTVAELAALSQIPIDAAIGRLHAAEARIQRALRNRTPRLVVDDARVRPEAFAGLLKLEGGIELEIAPKFAGPTAEYWREDFFYIATLSRFGRVLPREALQAGRGTRGDLATLAGRALVEMCIDNERRPIRTYRRRLSIEFSAEGDLEAENILAPDPDGFPVSSYSLSRQHDLNATLARAARLLAGEVRDGDTRRQLDRVARGFGPQIAGANLGRNRVLPGRAQGWQAAYDLACDVIGGFGLRFGERDARAPGFLVDTWRAWQDLLGIAARLGLPEARPSPLRDFQLGHRVTDGAARAVQVTPDLVLTAGHPVIVDAKYKGRALDGREAVSEPDLYETLAFLEASKAPLAVLIYPALPRSTRAASPPGSCFEFERITIGARTVIAVECEVAGISANGGLVLFAENLATWFRAHALA